MKNTHNLSLDEVISRIESLYMAQHSGTIFVKTEKSVMGQIILSEGHITRVHYLTKRGIEALEIIFKSLHFKLFSFTKRDELLIEPEVDAHLPSMTQIFEIIKKCRGGVDLEIKISNGKGKAIDIKQVVEIIITELTMHLGPIAVMVCEEFLDDAKDLADIMDALDKIAKEIDNAVTETEFKRLVIEKIQKI